MEHKMYDQTILDLTLILMYLSKFDDKTRLGAADNKSWKGYNFNVINDLVDSNYIYQSSYKAKSVIMTEEGIEKAKELLSKYNIEDI